MKIETATDLLLSLIEQAQTVSVMIRQAKEEGRDGLSVQEVDQLASANDASRQRLAAAIEEGRN